MSSSTLPLLYEEEQRRSAVYGAALDDILDVIDAPDALTQIQAIVEEARRDG